MKKALGYVVCQIKHNNLTKAVLDDFVRKMRDNTFLA